MPPAIRTVCLEFFGQVRDATPAIVEIKRYLDAPPAAARDAGRPRAPRRALREGGRLRDQGQAPRAAEDGAARRHRRRRRRRRRARRPPRWCASPTRAAPRASSPSRPRRARSSGSTARAPRRSPSTPTRSRSTRTSSSRSPRLGDYTDGIERINIELLDRATSSRSATRSTAFLAAPAAAHAWAPDDEARPGAGARRRQGRRGARAGRGDARALAGPRSTASTRRFRALQDHSLRVSWKTRAARRRWRRSSPASRSRRCCARCDAIHREVLRSRVFVALHMHAGDGNVHTNIPVNSDDYAMLQEANAAVARIMALAREPGRRDLRRARHRHHQARVPDRRRARALRRLQARGSIRRAASTPASCCATRRAADLANAYTPSFSLIGHESLILEQSRDRRRSPTRSRTACAAASASRCARRTCRARTCSTARATRSSRTSLLIEAFLYEEQTRRGVSLRHFDEFGDVADHCTVCHKCVNPCPVDIDFGDVSIAMRNLLRQAGQEEVQSRAPRRRCSSSTPPTRRRSSSPRR